MWAKVEDDDFVRTIRGFVEVVDPDAGAARRPFADMTLQQLDLAIHPDNRTAEERRAAPCNTTTTEP